MSRELQITDSQRQSSDRWDLHGVIYLLSGFLSGRVGVSGTEYYWSTQEVVAFGQKFKPYLGPPQSISRSMGFEPGSEPSSPEVRIPVRNLPFAHAESLVAAITDNDFRFENAEATLRVAYLRPGQTSADLADGDWAPLVLRGFLGPADEVTLDGFILPVYNRGAKRNQSLYWPRLPAQSTMSGGAIDYIDGGKMPPIRIGVPQGWVRVPTLNVGVRGHTLSGYAAGITTIEFQATTVGPENLLSGNAPGAGNFAGNGDYGTGTGKSGLMVGHLTPIYEVISAAYNDVTRSFTVTLNSGLIIDIDRGAVVQQWGPGYNPTTGVVLGPGINLGPGEDARVYRNGRVNHGVDVDANWKVGWLWAAGNLWSASQTATEGTWGWRLSNGEIKPATSAVWPMTSRQAIRLDQVGGQNLGGFPSTGSPATVFHLSRGTRAAPVAPCYYNPTESFGAVTAAVTAQPEFESTQSAFSVVNRGVSSTHTGTGSDDSDNAWDGADYTSSLVNDDNSITVSFGAAPAPFTNTDTTGSVLHLKVRGSSGAGVDVTNGAALTFFTIPGSLPGGEITEFTVAQGSPRNFNQTLSFFSNAAGSANIVEAWWEHDLSAVVPNTRTQDVDIAVTGGPTPPVAGPELHEAELVVKIDGSLPVDFLSAFAWQDSSGTQVPTYTPLGYFGGSQQTGAGSVMIALHHLLGVAEGSLETINIASYAEAEQKCVAEGIALNFIWDEKSRPDSWSELERMVSEQARCAMHYGPSGHEIMFLEAASGYGALPTQQTFRLPGCPGADVIPSNRPLLQRTRTTELVNFIELRWDPDWITGDMQGAVSGLNAESIAAIGTRKRDRGAHEFSLHGRSLYLDSATAVAGLAQFFADRQATAATRFTFDTAWIAHGLDRGSIIQVSYPVSSSPPSFRTVRAEVEWIEVAPLNGERFTITARSISRPTKGIGEDCLWADVFDSDDVWSDQIVQSYDTWEDYWSICSEDEDDVDDPFEL